MTDPEARSRSIQFEPDKGGGRIRSAAYLTVLSDGESPESLARTIGTEADVAWNQGDDAGHGRRRQPYSGVSFESHLEDSASPSDHLAALVMRMRPNSDGIKEIRSRPSTKGVRVTVVEHTGEDNRTVWAEPEDLAWIGEMGADLVVDLYFYDGE